MIAHSIFSFETLCLFNPRCHQKQSRMFLKTKRSLKSKTRTRIHPCQMLIPLVLVMVKHLQQLCKKLTRNKTMMLKTYLYPVAVALLLLSSSTWMKKENCVKHWLMHLLLIFLQDGAWTEVYQSRKRHFDECLEDLKAYQAAKQALRAATEREFVPRDMPALQLRGGPIRFEDRAMQESISAFFTAFEAQLHSYNLILDQHWERLFWQCLDNNQRSWFQQCLCRRHSSSSS